jgi:hypothetical protein
MVPDFPKTKSDLMKQLMNFYRRQIDSRSISVPIFMQHEGDRSFVQKEDSTSVEAKAEKMSSTIEIPIEKAPGMSFEEVKQKLINSAEEMAGQFMGMFFREMNQATAEAGTIVDAKGKPFDAEMFLEMLSRMWLYFDEKGAWEPPTLVVPPNALEKIKDEMSKWEKDPEFKAKMEKLLFQKREEWRARESRRKLVD